MTTFLPKDANDNPIPALRLRNPGAHTINASATSARNATGFNPTTRIVSIFATVPVFVKFGTSTVTATSSDHYFPANLYYDVAIGGDDTGQATHLAVLRTTTDGTVYVSEKF